MRFVLIIPVPWVQFLTVAAIAESKLIKMNPFFEVIGDSTAELQNTSLKDRQTPEVYSFLKSQPSAFDATRT